ncbi:MAG: PAS domain-containing protein [Pseudomonadota bacterium]
MNIFSQPIAMAETMLADSPAGILVYEGDTGNCVLANQAVADMLGESAAELRLQNFRALASRCQAGLDDLAKAILHGGLSRHHEVMLQTASGRIVSLDCSISRFDCEDKPFLLFIVADITARKPEQEKLVKERSLLRCLIDAVNDLIFIKDRDSVYRGCNKASETFIGLPECEQIGKTDFDFFDREKAAEIQKADRQVLEDGKPLRIEEWVTGRDGRRLLMDTIKAPYYDPDGKPLGLVGIGRDITERKRAEQERLAHLEFFENMDRVNRAIQANNDLEQMMSEVLGVVLAVFECDRAFLMYPCDPESPTWSVPMERHKPEYPGLRELAPEKRMDPQVAETLRIVLTTGGPVSFGPGTAHALHGEVAEQFGIQCFMSMALYPKTGGPWQFGIHQCAYALVWSAEEERLFQEIGRRLVDGLSTLLAHRDLQRSMERLEEAQHLAHIGSWELDLIHNVLTWSDEIFRIFEIDSEKFGASYEAFLDTIHPDDREAVHLAYTNSVETRTPYAIDHRLLLPDGRIKYVREQCETYYEGDTPVRSIGTVQDNTELKAADEALQRLNTELDQQVKKRTAELETSNRELEAFAYSVSHDLRAPLRHIDGFMELLQKKEKTALDDKSRHYMDSISAAAQKAGLLIDDLLFFSRMGSHTLSFQPVALGPLVRELIGELEPDTAGRNIAWCFGDLPTVRGDAPMLRMVLANLIANAVKFTRPREQAQIEIGSLPGQASETVIFVRDNGVGFDMAYADKLFGVFQRLHRTEEFEGTGIGMANVRRIIARHGGRTWAEGMLDQGATFYFSLAHKLQCGGDEVAVK